MPHANTPPSSIERRPDLGLAVSSTRITLYDILDYLHGDWPAHLIRDWLDITDDPLRVALDYLAAHHDEVEAESRQVLAVAEESRQYWEERNRERFAAIAAKHASTPLDARREALRANLAAHHSHRERGDANERQSRTESAGSTESSLA
jgi:hypothetical protein